MKIVYCVPRITTSGGIERILSDKAKGLLDVGCEVYFILIDKVDESPFFEFDERIKFYNLNCEFTARGLKKKFLRFRYKKIFIEKVTAVLDEIRPDIVISIFDKYSRYLYKVNDGSKKIIERHFGKYKRTQYLSKLEKNYLGKKIAYLYRQADYGVIKHYDKFIVLTEEDKTLWGNLNNIVTIPNSISFIPEEKSTTKEKRIITVARNSKQKQLDVLIKIWAIIAKKYPDWKLVTYGNGDLKPLRELAAKLGIDDQVENNPPTLDVQNRMVNSSIFVLSSKYEGMPLVLLEAMACGLPLVSYACKCGPKDIISDGEDGFLVKEGDMNEFADKLSLLIEDDELRRKMGKAASVNVQRYSKDIVIKYWISLFDELVND